MKKILFLLTAMIGLASSSSAMTYEQARREALFLTDKMAYELNLNQYQYDAAYEINLDYLMGVTSVDDVYGNYWTRRNLDMSYILYDWQWTAFQAATYFFRPLYFSAGNWHFGIYARYPHRSHFYFDRPRVYISYRGGHGMHHHRHSYYHDHRHHYRPSGTHHGMRDNHKRKHDNGRHDMGRHDNNRGHVREFRVSGTHNKGSFSNRPNTRPSNNNSNVNNRPESRPNNNKVNTNSNQPSNNRNHGSFSTRSNSDRRPSSVSSSSGNRRPSSVSSSSSNRGSSKGFSNRGGGSGSRGNNDNRGGGSFGGRR